jgi:hypothetical protein
MAGGRRIDQPGQHPAQHNQSGARRYGMVDNNHEDLVKGVKQKGMRGGVTAAGWLPHQLDTHGVFAGISALPNSAANGAARPPGSRHDQHATEFLM